MMPRWALDAWMNAMLRGQSFTAPTEHFVGLFKGTPGERGEGEISAAGYASEAVEIVEAWTREHWGVESALTTQFANRYGR